jgi:gliding motility-associated-like protein
MNWTEFSIEFVAHTDSLKFVIIGNFPTVKPLIKVFTTPSEMCAPPLLDTSESYYLIDDVRLYCLDCDTIDSTDTIYNTCIITFPDAFTPNGDNLNDTWKPLISSECDGIISSYLLRIYDCWDNEIFKTTDKNEGWTGSPKQTGTYFYYLQYDNKNVTQKKTGSITLIR